MNEEFVKVVYFDPSRGDVVETPPRKEKEAREYVMGLFAQGLSTFAQLLALDGRVLHNMAPKGPFNPDPVVRPLYRR